MAALHAGIPISTSIATVNRQCSSGLTAVNQIAVQIMAGQIDIGIGMCQRAITYRLVLTYLAQVLVSNL